MKRLSVMLMASTLVLSAGSRLTEACGGSLVVTVFWHVNRPSTSDADFAGGNLGIIGQKIEASRLWLAYRHLAGLGLRSDELAAVNGLLASRLAGAADPQPLALWLDARRQVPGAPPLNRISVYREKRVAEGPYEHTAYIWNCLDDAFSVAVNTLEERIGEYGIDSPEVDEWLRGQDAVFSNCSKGATLPPVLDHRWPVVLQRDRAYQRAAATFYSVQDADAERRFREIAADRDSHWAPTAQYLVARAMARAGRLSDAVNWLKGIADDPSAGPWRQRAIDLAEHYRFRIDPVPRTVEACQDISQPRLPNGFEQDVTDWVLGMAKQAVPGQPSQPCALTQWFLRWRYPHRVEKEADSELGPGLDVPTLVARLAAAEGGDADSAQLIELGSELDPNHPGFLTARFHAVRLLVEQGQTVAARARLDALLERRDLGRSDRNRMRQLRARTATELNEFLDDSLLIPVEVGHLDGRRVHPMVETEYWRGGDAAPTAAAIELLNRLSPNGILDLESDYDFPAGFRRRLVLLAWTRAVVLERFDEAQRAASRAAHLEIPEAAALQISENDERAWIEAALTLLRDRSLSPYLGGGAGDRHGSYIYPLSGAGLSVVHLAAQTVEKHTLPPAIERYEDRSTIEELHTLFSSDWQLGPAVIKWCRLHPGNPRVPEALHLVVRATRYPRWSQHRTGDVSREAFRLLHTRYPDSPWTEKTPYWFK